MDEKKQIEEMKKDIHTVLLHNCSYDFCEGVLIGFNEAGITRELYDEGYRKQSDGEWKPIIKCKTSTKTLIYYQCSLCGVYLASEANYCPNCGAKMKGGA